MKIALLIHEEYDFTFPMLRDLLPRLSGPHEVRGVLAFPDVLGRYRGLAIPLEYLRRFGPGVVLGLARRSLSHRAALLLRWVDRREPAFTFAGLCTARGVPFRRFRNPNDPEVCDWLEHNQVDVGLIFIGHIMGERVLGTVRECFLNKHSSLLPFSRGLFPVFWTLKEGAPVGATIHKVVARLDAGEIILQKRYEADPGASVYDWYRRIFGDAPEMVMRSLALLPTGERVRVPHALPPGYHSLPTRQDWVEFRRLGLRFV